jgi:hypothetical protein
MSDEWVTKISVLTDDQLRGELFHRLVARLETERKKDPGIVVANRTPHVFSLSRHGNRLTVDQGHQKRLMRVVLTWKHKRAMAEQDDPWKASVSRSADGARLVLSGGPEGTIEEMVDTIVDTFLKHTGPANATRTSWGRWIDIETGELLTVADLKQRLEKAGYDERQMALALALAIETGKVS